MKAWFSRFWDGHGERIVFAAMAYCMALAMWYLFDLQAEAKVIFIGTPMLFFNKARSPEDDKAN